jgi:adenylate cyclase class 2
MNPQEPIEIEVKLRISSTEAWIPALERLGFCRVIPAQTEQSVLWDRGAELLDRGCALRLRRYAGSATFTWKGPKTPDPMLKVRPERETGVSDPEAMEGILRALGYVPTMTMEKTRELWRSHDLVACLDQTPFGCFLELEGHEDAIRKTMADLGLGPELAEPRSYPALFQEHGLA